MLQSNHILKIVCCFILSATLTYTKNIEVLNKDTQSVTVSIENVPLDPYFSEGTALISKTTSPQVIVMSGDTVFKASGPASKDFIVQFENNQFAPQPAQSSNNKTTISGLSLTNNVLRNEIAVTRIPRAEYEARIKAEGTSKPTGTAAGCPSCPVCPTVDDVKAAKFLTNLGAADFKEAKKITTEMIQSNIKSITVTYQSFQKAANSKTFTTLLTKLIKESDSNPYIFLEPNTIKQLNDAMVNVVYQLKGQYIDYSNYLMNTGPIAKAYETFIKERKALDEKMKKVSTHEEQVELLWNFINSMPEYPPTKIKKPTNEEIEALKLS